MRIAILMIALLYFVRLAGQQPSGEGVCGTEDIPDPDFQPHVFEEFHAQYQRAIGLRSVVKLPILPRIVRHSEGTGGFDPALLEKVLEDLNQRFAPGNIEFFYCGEPAFVDVSVFYDFDRSLYADSLATYNVPGAINIYFINKILNDDTFICGYASFPWLDQEYVVVKNSCALNTSTVAHEIGHYLGLYHTHSTVNGFELADGSNCRFSGDEVCDTPADPRLGSHNVSTDCDYTGRERDLNNDRYDPDPSNVMSYSRKACRDFFSEGQFTRMAFYLEKDRTGLNCLDLVSSNQVVTLPSVKLFPTPARDWLFMESEDLDLTDRQLSVDIYNGLGQLVRSGNAESYLNSGTLAIPLRGLSCGMYVLRWSNEKARGMQQFVKL